ncbi:hypothetical protein NCCP2716_01930 [Sporosarcina sp. NCCP-2716]|uniref:DUF7147 family protein n=1 Tax=Sporosarcina sp. NCCP-2716 TaxID=2943679 RepID=UPI00204230F8|nr:methylthioribose kinase [Sporosarcina sp. NCCP-2716]GKV67695.1 hypothetical protein NCCP2716_01930 [Sporosarcina sp. NCCP-2716]
MKQQRFIELGEGYSDIFELCELIKTNAGRLQRTFVFTSEIAGKKVVSLAASFSPAGEGGFYPIYICREGIPFRTEPVSKRQLVFEEAASAAGSRPVTVGLKHSSEFPETNLFYQYVTGVLRLNHLLPPLD